jgi:hypothetical protein
MIEVTTPRYLTEIIQAIEIRMESPLDVTRAREKLAYYAAGIVSGTDLALDGPASAPFYADLWKTVVCKALIFTQMDFDFERFSLKKGITERVLWAALKDFDSYVDANGPAVLRGMRVIIKNFIEKNHLTASASITDVVDLAVMEDRIVAREASAILPSSIAGARLLLERFEIEATELRIAAIARRAEGATVQYCAHGGDAIETTNEGVFERFSVQRGHPTLH